MLPDDRPAGLYFITDPTDLDPPRSGAAIVCEPGSTTRPCDGEEIGEGPPVSSRDAASRDAATASNTDVDHDDGSNGGGGGAGGTVGGGGGGTKEAAMVAFMSAVHPMEILGRPRAFGGNGAIMRYHRIGNYAAALSGLVGASFPLPV